MTTRLDMAVSLACDGCAFEVLITDATQVSPVLAEHERVDGHRLKASAPPDASNLASRDLVLNGMLELLRIIDGRGGAS